MYFQFDWTFAGGVIDVYLMMMIARISSSVCSYPYFEDHIAVLSHGFSAETYRNNNINSSVPHFEETNTREHAVHHPNT